MPDHSFYQAYLWCLEPEMFILFVWQDIPSASDYVGFLSAGDNLFLYGGKNGTISLTHT